MNIEFFATHGLNLYHLNIMLYFKYNRAVLNMLLSSNTIIIHVFLYGL